MNRRTSRDPGTPELVALYSLLAEAVPLALERIETGGVKTFEQWAFWNAFQEVETFVDDLVDVTEPTRELPSPFMEAADECRPPFKGEA